MFKNFTHTRNMILFGILVPCTIIWFYLQLTNSTKIHKRLPQILLLYKAKFYVYILLSRVTPEMHKFLSLFLSNFKAEHHFIRNLENLSFTIRYFEDFFFFIFFSLFNVITNSHSWKLDFLLWDRILLKEKKKLSLTILRYMKKYLLSHWGKRFHSGKLHNLWSSSSFHIFHSSEKF